MTKPHPQKSNRNQVRLFGAVLATTCATLFALESGVHAQVAVPSTVNFNSGSGVYTYSYSVTNNGPIFDLAILTVPVSPISNLMNLLAPVGFGITFDPGVGLVSFFEDSNPATPQTLSPASTNGFFTFTTTFAPGPVTFQALDAGGNTFTGVTQSAIVPEPGTLTLLGLSLVGLISRRRSARSV